MAVPHTEAVRRGPCGSPCDCAAIVLTGDEIALRDEPTNHLWSGKKRLLGPGHT